MPDSRFFQRAQPKTVGELARIAGAQIKGKVNEDALISDVAPLDKAGPDDISFLDNPKYRPSFKVTRAGACLVSPEMAPEAPPGAALLVTKNPYKSYALVAQAFYPEAKPAASISQQALIDPSARIGQGCVIEAGAVIGKEVVLGNGTWIESGAVVRERVIIGNDCRIGANAVVSHSTIGNRVRVYPGCCIGQDGFGFAIDPAGHVKVPQLGRVIIEDSVEIGANTCIDRGSGPDTVIGQGTWIDNLVQIGHNVNVGKGCVLVGQCGIAGSTVLEDFVVLAAQSGVAGHLRLGRGARIAAKTGVLRDVEPGNEMMGYPALPIRQFLRQIAVLKRLTSNDKKNADD